MHLKIQISLQGFWKSELFVKGYLIFITRFKCGFGEPKPQTIKYFPGLIVTVVPFWIISLDGVIPILLTTG